MAKSQEWKVNSTTIENGRIKVSGKNKYVKDGVNKFSTFNDENEFGRVQLDPDSSDRIVKTTFYSIDSDGFIDFYRKGPDGNFKKYESIQEIADAGILGYNAKTTKLLKSQLQGELEKTAAEVKIPGAADPDKTVNNDGDPDKDNDAEDADTDEGGNTDSDTPSSEPIDITIEGQENKPSGNFVYPQIINTSVGDELDRIKFTQGEYAGLKIGGQVSQQNFNRDLEEGFKKFGDSSVIIGIQPQITDSNRVRWNGSNLNGIQAYAAAASANVFTAGEDAADKLMEEVKAAGQIIQQEGGKNSDIGKAINTFFASKAAGLSGGALLTRATGAILNPNLELLFEGPELRQFNYTFKMSAETPDEAIQIKNIIGWFKKGMSIRKGKNQLFLTTPNVFRIQYLKGETGALHDGLNRIKDCALLGCNVNYTAEGNYSTFRDGTMTMYEMSLSFGELNPIYSDDYDSAGSIGY